MPASSADPAIDRRRAIRTGLVLLGILALVGLSIVGLMDLAEEIWDAIDERDGIALWDRPVLDWAIATRRPSLVSAALAFSHSGGPICQPILALVVAALLWWRWRDLTPVLLIVIVELGAVAISVTGKNLMGRLRPPEADAIAPFETSASLPSGHTLQAFAFATIVAYLLIRQHWDGARWLRVLIGVLAFGYAATMGFTRVFLGYHWLTDVLAAAALGIAWAAAVIVCHRLWLARSTGRELWAAAKSLKSDLQGG